MWGEIAKSTDTAGSSGRFGAEKHSDVPAPEPAGATGEVTREKEREQDRTGYSSYR